MARKFGGPKFLILGAAFWLIIAAALGLARVFFPGLPETGDVVAVVVGVAVITGLIIVFFARPKS